MRSRTYVRVINGIQGSIQNDKSLSSQLAKNTQRSATNERIFIEQDRAKSLWHQRIESGSCLSNGIPILFHPIGPSHQDVRICGHRSLRSMSSRRLEISSKRRVSSSILSW